MLQLFKKFQSDEPQQIPQKQEPQQQQILLHQPLKFISQSDMEFQDNLINERNKEILEISKEQYAIHEMMQTLGSMAEEQGEIVDSIRHNITNTDKNVEKSNKDLGEAEESQKTGNKIAIGVLIATFVTVLTGGTIVGIVT